MMGARCDGGALDDRCAPHAASHAVVELQRFHELLGVDGAARRDGARQAATVPRACA
jgi:hypothetical protein